MTFVPRQGSWFVADDSDALNGRQEVALMPGDADMLF
jgi:hypothetical protein